MWTENITAAMPKIYFIMLLNLVSTELYHRLIRGTVHCMNSIVFVPPFERYPSLAEFEEMAKSIVTEYPCLMDSESI